MVSGFVWDLEVLSRKEDVNTAMYLPGPGRLWPFFSAILCCVFIWVWMCSWSHTVPLVFATLQIWAALSEKGDRLTDVRLHSWMLYGAALCQQSRLCRQLPAPSFWTSQVWAGIRLRTREVFLAQAACSYLNCFPYVWGPTATSPPWSQSVCVTAVWWGQAAGNGCRLSWQAVGLVAEACFLFTSLSCTIGNAVARTTGGGEKRYCWSNMCWDDHIMSALPGIFCLIFMELHLYVLCRWI